MKSFFQLFSFILIAAFLITACTIEHTVDFNEDMGGSSSMVMDFSEFVTEMGEMMPDSNITNDLVFKDIDMEKEKAEIQKDFDKIQGLSNLTPIKNSEEGKVGFQFDFENITALNKGFKSTKKRSKTKKSDHQLFVLDGKKLLVNFNADDLEGFKGDEEDAEMAGMIKMNYVFTINMPFPVKKVSNPVYLISEDRKTIGFDLDLNEMIENVDGFNTEITW